MIYTAIDFETADNGRDSACAIGLIKIHNNTIIDSYYALIKPPRSYIKYAYFHGITWDMLKNQPTFAERWHEIANFIHDSTAFIAHNAQFDKGVLYNTAKTYNISLPLLPFYCTLKASRQFLNLPKNSLDSVCQALNIELNHHHALSDAQACANIFLYFTKQGISLDNCITK